MQTFNYCAVSKTCLEFLLAYILFWYFCCVWRSFYLFSFFQWNILPILKREKRDFWMWNWIKILMVGHLWIYGFLLWSYVLNGMYVHVQVFKYRKERAWNLVGVFHFDIIFTTLKSNWLRKCESGSKNHNMQNRTTDLKIVLNPRRAPWCRALRPPWGTPSNGSALLAPGCMNAFLLLLGTSRGHMSVMYTAYRLSLSVRLCS